MKKRRLTLLLTACCLAGLILGTVWPPPPIPRARTEAAAWSLPSPAQLSRYSTEDAAQVTRAGRWSGETGTAVGVRGSWRLAGFVDDPDTAALIMPLIATPPPRGARSTPTRSPPGTVPAAGTPSQAERVVPGGSLPDGSKLLAINGDTITTELDGCRLVYQLYRPQAISASPGCEQPAAEAEPRKTE